MFSREKCMASVSVVVLAATLSGCIARVSPPAQDPAAPPVSQQVAKEDKREYDNVSNDTTRGLGWVLIGAGTVAGIVAVGTSILMIRNLAIRSSECNDAHFCSDRGVEANNQIRITGGWNLGAWIATAVGLGGGAFLVITHPKSNEPASGSGTTAVGVTPNNAGGLDLGMRGTF